MDKRKFCAVLFCLIFTALCTAAASAEQELSISMQTPGTVLFEGNIALHDTLRLYSREYRSAEQVIIDRLLSETSAESEGSAAVSYSPYSEPLAEERTVPDFAYEGKEITVKALYGTVSDGNSEIRSDLLYIECSLDTGVVNQYWCSLAGSTACGTAAGVLAMQISYPAAGDDLFTRVNLMRKYGTLGDAFSTGPSEYYLAGEHISNAVNKYITEELSESRILIDHRTPEKTTEETLIELLTTGRPAVIEVCYLLGNVTRDFQGISHWITINGFSLGADGYTFRFSDPITVSYRSISSEMLEVSNANVSYGSSAYVPVRYIGAFSAPLFSIE